MINTLIEDQLTAIIGLVVPAIGIAVWFIADRKTKNAQPEEHDG